MEDWLSRNCAIDSQPSTRPTTCVEIGCLLPVELSTLGLTYEARLIGILSRPTFNGILVPVGATVASRCQSANQGSYHDAGQFGRALH